MLQTIVAALAPIALLISLGYFLRRRRVLPDDFWKGAERITFYVLIPALLIHGLATAKLDDVPVFKLVGVIVAAQLVVATAMSLLRPVLRCDGPAFTSVFQGGVRFNNYIAFTASVGLFGPPAVAMGAVANAAIVPCANILCSIVFALHAGSRPGFLGVLKSVALNPLMLGVVIGVAVRCSGFGLPIGVDGFLKALGQASLSLGLLCVGAALNWSALGEGLRATAFSSVAKLALMPAATAAGCLLLGLQGVPAAIAVLFQSMPTSSSGYIFARTFGGDASLMASIIVAQTMMAAVTLPLVLMLLG